MNDSMRGKLMKFQLGMILTIWSSTGIQAEEIPGTFQDVFLDGGGWFTGLTQHGDGRLYGRTDVGGCYRSDDYGNNWTYLGGDMPTQGSLCVQGIAVSPNDPDLVVQAAGVSYFPDDPGRGIWKSDDGGESWKHVKPDLNFSGNDEARHGGECLIFHPAKTREIIAGSRSGIWRSVDEGDTWSPFAPEQFGEKVIVSIHITARQPDLIWVGTEGGLYLSSDAGKTWDQLLEEETIFRIVQAEAGKIYVTGGKLYPEKESDTRVWEIAADDWSDLSGFQKRDLWPRYLAAHDKALGWRKIDVAPALTILDDGRIIVAPHYSYPASTDNGGESFELLGMKMADNEAVPAWQNPAHRELIGGWNQFLQCRVDPNRWYATGGYGPGRSDDGGKSWKYIVKGITEMVTWQVSFHPKDPNQIYIPCADHGLGVITDGGRSGRAGGFIAHHFPYPDDNVVFSHTGFAIGNTVYAPGGDGESEKARLYFSGDRGGTWQKKSRDSHPNHRMSPWIDGIALNEKTIVGLIGGKLNRSGGVYRSVNGGETFARVKLPDSATDDYQLGGQFDWYARLEKDASESLYLSMRWEGLFRSGDAGESWEHVGTSGMSYNHDGRLGVNGKRSKDLWFASVEGLYRSRDGGNNWSRHPHFHSAEHVDAWGDDIAVLGHKRGEVTRGIFFSCDDGKTWGSISRKGRRFGSAQELAVDPWRSGTVWVSTSGRSVTVFRKD